MNWKQVVMVKMHRSTTPPWEKKTSDGLENCCSGSLVWTTTAEIYFYSQSDFQDESNAPSADMWVVVRAPLSGTTCSFTSFSLKTLHCLVQMSGLAIISQQQSWNANWIEGVTYWCCNQYVSESKKQKKTIDCILSICKCYSIHYLICLKKYYATFWLIKNNI